MKPTLRSRLVALWPLWLALVPAVLIALNQVRKDGRTRVEVVGAGAVALLADAPRPDGIRFGLEVEKNETFEASIPRIETVLNLHPGIVVFGLDADPIAKGTVTTTVAKEQLGRLARIASRAATVTVIVEPHPLVEPTPEGRAAFDDLSKWWRESVCRQHRRVRCVGLREHGTDRDAIVKAMNGGIVDGVRHLEQLRATTQVGR